MSKVTTLKVSLNNNTHITVSIETCDQLKKVTVEADENFNAYKYYNENTKDLDYTERHYC